MWAEAPFFDRRREACSDYAVVARLGAGAAGGPQGVGFLIFWKLEVG